MTPTTIFLHDPTTLRVSFPYSVASVAAIKQIGGARWHPESRTWRVPLERLDALLAVFGDSAVLAPEVVMAAEAEQQEVIEPRQPATPEQRLLWFMDTLVWAGVTLRIAGERVIGSGGCWTPILQAEIDRRAVQLRRLLEGGWQAPVKATAPVAPAPANFDLITDFDRAAARYESNWLANEARKQDMIEGRRRKSRKKLFQQIDRQLGLEEVQP
jgi:hypothetical protein